MPQLLTTDELDEFLSAGEWEGDADAISKTFEFDDFNEALGFVTRVGLKAERLFHHPDIDIRWNEVTLALTTHDAGGVTDKDLELAEFCDGAA